MVKGPIVCRFLVPSVFLSQQEGLETDGVLRNSNQRSLRVSEGKKKKNKAGVKKDKGNGKGDQPNLHKKPQLIPKDEQHALRQKLDCAQHFFFTGTHPLIASERLVDCNRFDALIKLLSPLFSGGHQFSI